MTNNFLRKLTITLGSLVITIGLSVSGTAIAAPADDPAAPVEPIITIADIQGDAAASPKVGQTVNTTGVVTAVLPGRGGFIIQMKSSEVPKDFKGSSALFIKVKDATVKVGDEVKVKGKVAEYYDEKDKAKVIGVTTIEVAASGDVSVIGTGKIAEINIPTLPMAKTDAEAMSREIMLFKPAGIYRVTGNDQLVYRGQLSINDGDKPLLQPTQAGKPGSSAAVKQAEYNTAHMVILDDGNDAHFDISFGEKFTAEPPKALPYMADAAKGPTIGATVTFNQPVVVNKVEGKWVMDPTQTQPTSPAAVSFSAVRENSPANLTGNFKLATFNVLNYFTTFGETNTEMKDGKKICYPEKNLYDQKYDLTGNWDCPNRGAWNEESFKRQQVKIVNAINKLGSAGAQIVGLQEIENSTKFNKHYDSALKHLVEEINKADSKQGWAYAPAPKTFPKYGHNDVIRQAFIYKKSQVALVGESKFLDDPAYQSAADARAPIAQAFKHLESGKVILVINNHITYKGGKVVGDDNANPGKTKGPAFDTGNNNGDRERQAKALVKFAAEQAKELKADYQILVGDFNAYSYESPIQVMLDAGYADLMNTDMHPSRHSATNWNEYTYSYRAIFGSLDHVMVSQTGMKYFKDFDVWTSNGYEPVAYEYARFMDTGTNYWHDDVFRASDHNASLVSFEIPKKTVDSVKPIVVEPPKQPVDPNNSKNMANTGVTLLPVFFGGLIALFVGGIMIALRRRIDR